MQAFVFWTGLYNLVLGCALFFPVLLRAWGVHLPDSVLWTELLGWATLYLGILLVLCSRNLGTRGSLVWWAGALHLMVGALMAWFGIAKGAGAMIAAGGAVDLFIGAVYVAALPRHLRRTHADLALDRK